MSADRSGPMSRQAETWLRKWGREHRPDLLTLEAVEAAREEWRRDRKRQYYQENRDQVLDAVRRYRDENRDLVRERDRNRYKRERDERLEYQRRYRAENPEKIAERDRRYREENREAIAEYHRRYRAENPEKVAERKHRYYVQNREARAEYNRRYYDKNRDDLRARNRQYREENREALAEGSRRYYVQNREVFYENVHRRRARMAAGVPRRWRTHDVPPDRCYWCGDYIGPTTTHVDHVHPIARGGAHEPENTVNVCPLCNLSKRAMTPLAWIASMFDESTPTGDRLRQRDL